MPPRKSLSTGDRLRDRELTGRRVYDKGPWTNKARHNIREELKELRDDVRGMHHTMTRADKRAVLAQIDHELEDIHTIDSYNLQAFRQECLNRC